jgi:hypothetical protein
MILSLTNSVILIILNISASEITDNKLDNEFRIAAAAGIFLVSAISRPEAYPTSLSSGMNLLEHKFYYSL